ncbi:MAG: HEAT repeat domain-containing protein [Thermoanaerobaculia bacterium]
MTRNLALCSASLLLFSFACTSAPSPATWIQTPAPTASPGLTEHQEARILRLEDRREFDQDLFETLSTDANPRVRARVALALGRIGPSTFVDANGNGVLDPGEKRAGVAIVERLATDPDTSVRRTAAFALGEIGDSSAIPTLLGAGSDAQQPDVASEAVEALSKMAHDVPLDSYRPFLSSPHPEGVRARAYTYLFRFGSDDASLLASDALADPAAVIRREAAYTLSRRAFPPARQRLELLTTDGDTLTRAYVARALGLIADPTSIDAVSRLLGDPHPWVRTNAARALGAIIDKTPSLVHRPANAEFLARILSTSRDPDAGTRIEAIPLLGRFAAVYPPARERLIALATSGSSWEREVATAAVAKFLADDADSPLDALLQTDSRWIRIRALEGSADSEKGTGLRARFASDPDAAVRTAVISTIPASRLDAEIATVRKEIDDPDPIVRATALDRLSSSHSVPADEMFDLFTAAEERGRTDTLDDARLAAIRGLAGIEDPRRKNMLGRLITDRDPVVRQVTAELMVEKLHEPRPQFTPLPIDRPFSDYLQIVEWSRKPHTARLSLPRGTIDLLLLPQDAPMTAWNFASLAKSGYFDGTTFMRVVPNFVIQGGDPRNDQNGGPGYAIRDEINMQKYTRGAVGMALSGPDTGGSQFFITHSPQPHLDGGYTIFARVVGGMSGVVDQLERGDVVKRIEIDAGTMPSTSDVGSVQTIPLPTEVGSTTAEHLLQVIPEYIERKDAYIPDPAVLQMLASSIQEGDRVEVILGTWCTDSQREVPHFLRIVEELQRNSGVTLSASYVAVNRAKDQPSALLEGKDVQKVATFIYYRGDREIGRIVEEPEGRLEDDLLRIAGSSQ